MPTIAEYAGSSERKIIMAKKVLMVGSEMVPYAATGGLGDVLGSLPEACMKGKKKEFDIRVIMPL